MKFRTGHCKDMNAGTTSTTGVAEIGGELGPELTVTCQASVGGIIEARNGGQPRCSRARVHGLAKNV
ncbi:MAG: hypothetical protein GY809_29840 [Planctomycetes bacterium]|nr:hypothetical protein [Planctomycetota bacterium]